MLCSALVGLACLGAAPADAARAKPRPATRDHHRKRRPHKPRGPHLTGDAARAQAAYAALQKWFYLPGRGLYRGQPYSSLWPFSQALAATISVANIKPLRGRLDRDLQARRAGLAAYWAPPQSAPAGGAGVAPGSLPAYAGQVAPPLGPGGPKFYDDNAWVGIELVRLYKLQRNPADLAAAQQVLAFIRSGWDGDQTHPCPGGVPFSNAATNTDRNTVTAAPGAELGAQLYRLTRVPDYIDFTKAAYLWVRRCLLQPSGLYGDHIRFDGTVDRSVWSYNQGTMIGAGVMLARITGDQTYRQQAREAAAAATVYFTPARLTREPPFFPSVFFRNLLLLDSVAPNPAYRSLVKSYANRAWSSRRQRTNVFVAQSGRSTVLTQASFAEDYALLATTPASYF